MYEYPAELRSIDTGRLYFRQRRLALLGFAPDSDVVKDREDRRLVPERLASTPYQVVTLLPETAAPGGAPPAPPEAVPPTPNRVNESDAHVWVKVRDDSSFSPARYRDLAGRFDAAELSFIGPVYRLDGARPGDLFSPVPNLVLVRGKDPLSAALRQRMVLEGLQLVWSASQWLARIGYELYEVDEEIEDAYRVKTRLLQHHGDVVDKVHWVTVALRSPSLASTNDPREQWGLGPYGVRVSSAANKSAWDLETGESAIEIGVLEKGFHPNHPDLPFDLNDGFNAADPYDQSLTVQDTIGEDHGTKVAGIVGAIADNNQGVAGVAHGCTIVPIKYNGTSLQMSVALSAALRGGVRVMNISQGWDYDFAQTLDDTPVVENMLAAVTAPPDGLVVCAGTGNDAGELSAGAGQSIYFPASHADVVACGGSNRGRSRWRAYLWGSNFKDGPNPTEGVTVAAPADEIDTTDLDAGGYQPLWGTSAATPHVAGVAGLVLSRCPGLSPSDVRSVLEKTAELPDTYKATVGDWHPALGYGIVDAFAALGAAARLSNCKQTEETVGKNKDKDKVKNKDKETSETDAPGVFDPVQNGETTDPLKEPSIVFDSSGDDDVQKARDEVLMEFGRCSGLEPSEEIRAVAVAIFENNIGAWLKSNDKNKWEEPIRSYVLRHVCKIARQASCDPCDVVDSLDVAKAAKDVMTRAEKACKTKDQSELATPIGDLCRGKFS